jgi:transposase-like protein
MTATSERKLAENRVKMLQFAETLGNVTEACRKLGVSRTQFYEYKKRFEQHGIDGLRDLPPIHKTHPQTTPPEVVGSAPLPLNRGTAIGKSYR